MLLAGGVGGGGGPKTDNGKSLSRASKKKMGKKRFMNLRNSTKYVPCQPKVFPLPLDDVIFL